MHVHVHNFKKMVIMKAGKKIRTKKVRLVVYVDQIIVNRLDESVKQSASRYINRSRLAEQILEEKLQDQVELMDDEMKALAQRIYELRERKDRIIENRETVAQDKKSQTRTEEAVHLVGLR